MENTMHASIKVAELEQHVHHGATLFAELANSSQQLTRVTSDLLRDLYKLEPLAELGSVTTYFNSKLEQMTSIFAQSNSYFSRLLIGLNSNTCLNAAIMDTQYNLEYLAISNDLLARGSSCLATMREVLTNLKHNYLEHNQAASRLIKNIGSHFSEVDQQIKVLRSQVDNATCDLLQLGNRYY